MEPRRRLKVFRSITKDLSPHLSDQSFPYFLDIDVQSHIHNLSQTFSLQTANPKDTHPQVASNVFKSAALQNIQKKIEPRSETREVPAPNAGFTNRNNNLSTESSSREELQERGKPKKQPLCENEKGFYIIKLDLIRGGKDLRTTVMIKNIPNKYSQKMLLRAIDKKFAGTYDFLYLPIDFKNRCNVGYAFVNFLDCRTIVEFFSEFYGKRWEKFNSEKVCDLAYGRIQGFNELVKHFQNSSVINQDDNKVKPVLFG